MEDAAHRVERALEELGAEPERQGPREWAVRVPSERRGHVLAGVACGESVLTVRAFLMRNPDRRHEAVYRRLLQKQLTTYAWRFALDDYGDVYMIAQVPLAAADAEELDRLLGALATCVDEVYEGIVREGFDVPEDTVIGPPPDAA